MVNNEIQVGEDMYMQLEHLRLAWEHVSVDKQVELFGTQISQLNDDEFKSALTKGYSDLFVE